MNPDATRTELQDHLKAAQNACQAAMIKIHGAQGGPSCTRSDSGGPRVEEVN